MSKSKTKIYNFRFGDDLIAKIDAWREQQEIEPTRTDIIKLALERFFDSPNRAETEPGSIKKKAIPKNRLHSSSPAD